jgi:hypothetical protein
MKNLNCKIQNGELKPGPRSQEERHLCQPCFEEVFQHRPEVLSCLRKAEADAVSR